MTRSGGGKRNCAALAAASVFLVFLIGHPSIASAAVHSGAWPAAANRGLSVLGNSLPGPLAEKTARTGAGRMIGASPAPAAGSSFIAITTSRQPAAFQPAPWEIQNDSGEFYVTRGDAGLPSFGSDRPRGWSRSAAPSGRSASPQPAAPKAATTESRTYAMLLAGLALMGFVAHRRQRARSEN